MARLIPYDDDHVRPGSPAAFLQALTFRLRLTSRAALTGRVAAWETLGAPARREITAAQIEQIRAHSDLETAAPAKRVTGLKRGDDWSTKLRLDPHGVALLVLTPE